MRALIVKDINNGIKINDNYNMFLSIKDENDFNSWKEATLNFSTGTYSNNNLITTIKMFDSELHETFLSEEFLKTLERILKT